MTVDLFNLQHVLTPSEHCRLCGGTQAKGYTAMPGVSPRGGDLQHQQPLGADAARQGLPEVRADGAALGRREAHRRSRDRAGLRELEGDQGSADRGSTEESHPHHARWCSHGKGGAS